jgi:hypothetical protein
MTRRGLLVLLVLIGLAKPLAAQPPEASAALRSRAAQVVAFPRGESDPAAMFTPAFLAQVPPAQFRPIARQLAAQYGTPRRLEGLDADSPLSGTMHVATENGLLHLRIVIESQPPSRIAGLLVSGAALRGDTLAAVIADVRALPGQAGFAVARLGIGAPQLLASLEAARSPSAPRSSCSSSPSSAGRSMPPASEKRRDPA